MRVLPLFRMRPGFNTQPPEGGWILPFQIINLFSVSTHSRLKAAGLETACPLIRIAFQHTAA